LEPPSLINKKNNKISLEKTDTHSENELRKPYNFKDISVVGMSTNVEKPARFVPKYLIYNGYNIIPVNPTTTQILGRKSYSAVA
jgi:predicted CoA-binding protein